MEVGILYFPRALTASPVGALEVRVSAMSGLPGVSVLLWPDKTGSLLPPRWPSG